ncbi:MAG: hypothetical protein QOD53_1494, partial [Thermoleophilaceae bacterium]|nr:hypothetical protein [Thermoleophilaceae bacterium]
MIQLGAWVALFVAFELAFGMAVGTLLG